MKECSMTRRDFVGDSLREKIDYGLANCRYGAVLLSTAFFDKQWPQKELDGLFARHVEGQKILLPIRYDISQADLLSRSPILAGILAADIKDGIPVVAGKLLRVIKPEALKIQDAFRAANDAASRISERINEVDSRLYARVATGHGVGTTDIGEGLLPKGLLASLQKEGVKVDLFASDVGDYNKDPWKIRGRLSKKGHRKLEEFLKTGERTIFSASESAVTIEQLSKLFPGRPMARCFSKRPHLSKRTAFSSE